MTETKSPPGFTMPCSKGCGFLVQVVNGVEAPHTCGDYILRDDPREKGTRWHFGKPYHWAWDIRHRLLTLLPGWDPRTAIADKKERKR